MLKSRPALVILSNDLPEVNGEEVCPRVRKMTSIPIIALVKEETRGAPLLQLGADAYMIKPPSSSVLVARVRSLLRRRKKPNNKAAGESGDSDQSTQVSKLAEQSGKLTSTEFRLLSCLALSGGVLSHNQLIAEVWGGKPVTLDSLKFYVRRLRQKLQGHSHGEIISCRGVGYRMVAKKLNEEIIGTKS